MAVKRGGLGKGLDSLIPDHKTVKTTEKKKPEVEEKKEGEYTISTSRQGEFKKEMTIMKLLQAKEDGEPQKWLE